MCPCRLSGLVPTLLVVALIGCGDELSTEVDVPLQGPTTPQGPQATPPNAAPLAVAGPDQAAECATHAGSSVTLTSAGSGDSDGQITLYEWFESGELIAEIPTGTETLYLDVVVALNKDLASTEEYARVRGILLTTRAKVILETSLPGLARIETTLNDARDLPGDIQQCSYS